MSLSAKALSLKVGDKTLVDRVDLHLEPGRVIGLLGPNGAGKTTTFTMLVGIVRPTSGQVFLDGKDVTDQPLYKRARLGLGYLPQKNSLFRGMSVQDNLLAAMELAKVPSALRKEHLTRLATHFSLEPLLTFRASVLSGGESRRLEMARSLIMNPKYLLLDEPFAGVDPVTVDELKQLLKNVSQQGIGVLITDHNVRETLSLCDHSYVLYKGNVLAQGSSKDLLTHPKVRETYLGDQFCI